MSKTAPPQVEEYMSPVEVKGQRGEYETDSKWKSRSEFMRAHLETIPKKRLITLSNCYVNVKHDGCKYPPALMKELDELVAAIPGVVNKNANMAAKRFLEDASTAASKRFQGIQAHLKHQGEPK